MGRQGFGRIAKITVMKRSRAGWKVVTLIVLFLMARAIAGTVLEVKLVGDHIIGYRAVMLVGWLLMLVGVGRGFESMRFVVVTLMALGSAFLVAALADPQFNPWGDNVVNLKLLKGWLMFVIGSNVVAVVLLAFLPAVRSFFSRVHGYGR